MSREKTALDTWALFDVPRPEEGGVDSYLQTILGYCSQLFSATVVSAFLRIEGTTSYRLAAVFGPSSIDSHTEIQEGEGIAGAALQLREPILVDNPLDNPVLKGRVSARRVDVGSSMVIPLSVRGEPLGVLNLARNDDEHRFGTQDLRRASALAGQISLAVSNFLMIEQLKRAEEEIRTVFECIGVAVMVVDRHGIRTKNPEALKLLGEGDLEAICSRLTEGVSDILRKAILAGLAGTRQNLRVQSADGKATWQVKVAPMPSGAVTVAIEDLSFAVEATKELDRVKRLAEIGQMTAALAHEIRNPLTGIRSAAQFLTSSPDQAEDIGRIIEQEAIKLNGLCDEFLHFARPTQIKLNECSLNRIIHEITEFHRQEFNDKGVRLVVVDDHEWYGMIDASQIGQVIRNLLLNALQACLPGDHVTVIVSEHGFSVQDNGYGMDAETMRKLFTPFFTTKPKGTGLGLSNVQKIISAHQGQVSVDSQPGTGTCVFVSIPNPLSVAA